MCFAFHRRSRILRGDRSRETHKMDCIPRQFSLSQNKIATSLALRRQCSLPSYGDLCPNKRTKQTFRAKTTFHSRTVPTKSSALDPNPHGQANCRHFYQGTCSPNLRVLSRLAAQRHYLRAHLWGLQLRGGVEIYSASLIALLHRGELHNISLQQFYTVFYVLANFANIFVFTIISTPGFSVCRVYHNSVTTSGSSSTHVSTSRLLSFVTV